jgi:DNA-directed RNA polymerase subunit beta'
MPKTFGQILVNDLLPKDLQTTQTLDKKGLHERLYTLARRSPAEAARTMDQIRQLGHEIATTEGTSISLEDITPDYKARNAALKPALKNLQGIADPVKRQQVIMEAQKKLEQAMPKFHGSQAMMVRSGTRGAPPQLMRSFMAPVSARDPQGNAYPWLVHHSYSEGLRPSEIWATNMESRNNLLAANLAVTEPGDFSKILVNNMGDQLVLDEDCGTQNGIEMRTDDANVVDRYLAKPAGGFKAGTQITPQVFSQIRKKVKSVIVRSPMTCEHNGGICQRCYGSNETGKLHQIGTNVGIRSAQAITEPLTQFTLSARHGVRQAGFDARRVQGLKGLRQFLEIPQTFMNKAILATEPGTIAKIKKAPQGGYNITAGQSTYYAPPSVAPSVEVGQKVLPGDALTDGIPRPDEVVRYKGMGAGRKYMVDQLHDVYKSQGVDVDKRHFEILARTHLNHVQIDEDPEGRFFPGEVVNYTTMMRQLSEDAEKQPLKKAQGRVLARGYLHHAAGTQLTPEISKELSKNGIKAVQIARNPPKVSFVMQPVTSNPLLNPNWLARLGHRNLKATALEAAHFGEKADIHGTHPVPGFAYGAEFGKGPGGRY